jgi:hypothetical protein
MMANGTRGRVFILSEHDAGRLTGILLTAFRNAIGLRSISREEWQVVLDGVVERDGKLYAYLCGVTRETDNNGAPGGIG